MNFIKTFVVLTGLFIAQAQAYTISFDQSSQNVSLGDVFSMDVIGTDFLSSADGGGFNLNYDTSVLNILSVSIDESVWNFGGFGISLGNIDNLSGNLDGVMVNTLGSPGTSFVVATIQFEAVGFGLSELILSEYLSNPWVSGFDILNPEYVNSNINVSAVPVPTAVWLFGSGLMSLAGFAKRKK